MSRRTSFLLFGTVVSGSALALIGVTSSFWVSLALLSAGIELMALPLILLTRREKAPSDTTHEKAARPAPGRQR
jgi:hypothetical protein